MGLFTKKKYDKEAHKRFLIATYKDGRRDDSPFRNATFNEGVAKLQRGVEPKRVEFWVEALLKAWSNI